MFAYSSQNIQTSATLTSKKKSTFIVCSSFLQCSPHSRHLRESVSAPVGSTGPSTYQNAEASGITNPADWLCNCNRGRNRGAVGSSNRQTKEQSYTSSALNYITPQPSLWCVSVYLTLLPFLLRPFLYSLLPLFSPAFTATTAFVSLPPCLTSLPQVTTSAGCFPLEYISWDFRP